MNKRDLNKFEKLLLQERQRIVSEVMQIESENLGESEGLMGQDFSNFAEVGTDNYDREVYLKLAGAEAELVREIDDALDRIKNGTYGVCEGTGKPIPKKRLEVFPWARYTVDYQEQIERENSGYKRGQRYN